MGSLPQATQRSIFKYRGVCKSKQRAEISPRSFASDGEFRKGIDRYGLAVMKGSKPLKQLGEVAKRAAACDAPTPFWTAIDDLNTDQKNVLKAVVTVLESMGLADAEDVAWRVLGSGLVVLEIDPASAEGPQRARLRSWVDSRVRSPERTEGIVNTLYKISSQRDKDRGSVSLAGLERELLSAGHRLTSSPSAPMIVTLESMAPVRTEELAPAILEGAFDRFDMDLRDFVLNNVLTNPGEAVQRVADENSPLRCAVHAQKGRPLVLCGRAHIPLAALVGYLVGDRGGVRVLDWHPNADDQCWKWPEPDQRPYLPLTVTEFGVTGTMAIRFSLSFWVGEASPNAGLPDVIERTVGIPGQIVHLSHTGLLESRSLRGRSVRSQRQVRAYADTFRGILDCAVGSASQVDVFYAVPLSVAFELGRRIASTMHPPTTVWNYEAGQYTWGICLNPRNEKTVGAPETVFALDWAEAAHH